MGSDNFSATKPYGTDGPARSPLGAGIYTSCSVSCSRCRPGFGRRRSHKPYELDVDELGSR